MKFLFFSEAGDGMGLALRILEEGNEVAMWLRATDEADGIGNGLVPRLTDWKTELDEETICVFDCTGMGHFATLLRRSGYSVLGSSYLTDRLEMDRAFAKDTMKSCGVKTPKSKSFNDWDKAKEFVSEHENKMVFKPDGDLSGVVPSYVSSGQDDLLETMEHYRSQFVGKPEFELQEFTEGVALSTEGWFDGSKFLRPFDHTIERKELMNGDLGPSGGCTGNLVWLRDDDCPLLMPLEKLLAEHGYVGAIDINTIITPEGEAYGLEYTPRFGYDATPTLFWELLDGELGRFFSDIARGQAEGDMPMRDSYAAGVRVTIPPWPTEKHNAPAGLPIEGVKSFDNFYPYNVMLNSARDLVTAGAWGILGVATGSADSIEGAFEAAYKVAKKVKVPGIQYRTDLAEVCKSDHRKIARLEVTV